ncbi:MAG: GYD domain-containing protein [Dehalococcoidales bacterium]|nr:GYD domain-containing protein [Dehalococcoidales bacterium]
MAGYIVFFGFTEQGIKNIKDSPQRVEAAKQIFENVGARVKDFYLLMGMDRYDTMFIVESPDDETVARASLQVGSLGNVHINTIRAFSQDEFKNIISRLET